MKYYFQCPRCSNDERFFKPQEQADNLGWVLLVFGGIVPALLYSNHSRHRVQCGVCGTIFRQPSLPQSPVGKFARSIIALIFILVVVAMVLFAIPELGHSLPAVPVIETIEHAVADQPRIAAYFMTFLIALVFVSCWVSVYLSNAKFRRQLSKELRLDPVSFRQSVVEKSPPQVSSVQDQPV